MYRISLKDMKNSPGDTKLKKQEQEGESERLFPSKRKHLFSWNVTREGFWSKEQVLLGSRSGIF